MLQKIKNKLTVLAIGAGLLFPMALPAVASAQISDSPVTGGVCSGAQNLAITSDVPNNCAVSGSGTEEGSFNTLLTKIINIISVIVGVVAVIMIIFGGFKYITSGGSPDKVTGAKNTILYGIIGLIIVALAQVIVKFVLKQVTDAAQ